MIPWKIFSRCRIIDDPGIIEVVPFEELTEVVALLSTVPETQSPKHEYE